MKAIRKYDGIEIEVIRKGGMLYDGKNDRFYSEGEIFVDEANWYEFRRQAAVSAMNALTAWAVTSSETVESRNRKLEGIPKYAVRLADLLITELQKDDPMDVRIRRALYRHNGNIKMAAEELEISERTLYRRARQYEIELKK